MGADGIREASDISVLANNYMDKRLSEIRGLAKSNPANAMWRMEMTRWGLGPLKEETGVGTLHVQNRMTDFGIDAYWLSHEPWVVPEPFTPEAGEMYGKEDIDLWVDVLAHVCAEAYSDPEIVKTAPHNQAIRQLDGTGLDDPARWATTWRAYRRKHGPAPAKAAELG
jgi:glycine dehydrogenase subunit 2